MADRAPTLAIGSLTGTWAAVYRRRDQLEADAAEQVLAAWRAVAAGLDLAGIVAVLRNQAGPVEAVDQDRRRHLRQVTTAAVLARLVALTHQPGWAALIAAITTALRRARAAGRSAADAILDDAGDTELPEDEDDGDEDADLATAYTVTAAAMRGTAQTIAGTLLSGVEQGDDEQAMQDQADAAILAGAAWSLAAITASAAAFTTSLVTAYLNRDVQQLDYVTAGDGRVCARCSAAEDHSPYPANSAPVPPLHPNCRCTLQPTRTT